ncbi:hypothetical protein BDZ94DRAFT_377280 [Collybia nuda]|uniref:Uncharacterized protein n=1 Tax=Collybia nuda TaxID=64659 RepID=A0A9P5YG95_9AGAR|nr:hypothetical protein BDZ94DRAFT_377280 [Collybia nuda]
MRRKPRQKRNISGLRNQPKVAPLPLHSSPTSESIPEGRENGARDSDKNSNWFPHTKFDSLKPVRDEDESSDEGGAGDVGTKQKWSERNKLGQEGFHVTMMNTAIENGDDPRDEDWIPENSRRKRVKVTSQCGCFCLQHASR